MIRNFLFVLSILVSSQTASYAQSNLRKQDLCPDYREIDPLKECLTVTSYAELAEIIDNAPSGSEVTLCPFFIRKVTSIKPITIKKGVRVQCARTAPDEFCTLIGLGNHIVIDTAEDTMWQGLSFRGSNDHAVLVSAEVENAESATHTFCHTSFLENTRTKDTRGGSLMLEKSAGTVNIVDCLFKENYSKTFGAAIYSRASQLNIINTVFLKNKCIGFGPALYVAIGGSVMIKSSSFLNNKGRDGHDTVFNPGNGTSIYEDGFKNKVNDGDCRGVFNIAKESCFVFEKSPPSAFPTNHPTKISTSRPTMIPSQKLTARITMTPSLFPTIRPSEISTSTPTMIPTKTTTKPSQKPTKKPTQVPTTVPSQKPTTKNTLTPPTVKKSTLKPTSQPIASSKQPSLVVSVTVKPTVRLTPGPMVTMKPPMMPTPKRNDITGSPESTGEIFGEIISNKCLLQKIPVGRKCMNVTSFKDFKVVIETGNNNVIFCGGFNFRKTGLEAVHISNDIDVHCIDQCSFYGVGPFLNIDGVSKIRLMNLKFVNSRDSSAVIVSTVSTAAQTTFCDTVFERNQVSIGKDDLGGAITIKSRSGTVNVVNNTFTGNIASRGGAIHSNGSKLNIVGSKFVANNAYNSGNAIFVGEGNHLSVQSSIFILNTEVFTRSSGRGGSDPNSVAIAVQPITSIRTGSTNKGTFEDGGSNEVILSGSCEGFYLTWKGQCENFN